MDQLDLDSHQDTKGRFKKGNAANSYGRSGKKKALTEEKKAILSSIYDEANGNAMVLMELMLKNGAKLELDIKEGLKIAREVVGFQSSKKASIEVKSEQVSEYRIVRPDYEKISEVIDITKDNLIDN